jgi:hypothetical protein
VLSRKARFFSDQAVALVMDVVFAIPLHPSLKAVGGVFSPKKDE